MASALKHWRKKQGGWGGCSPLHVYGKATHPVITLGAHAQRGYGSWSVHRKYLPVTGSGYINIICGLCVCLSVTLHLTSRMFVRLTNDTTYLKGNEGQNIRTVFSENAPLQS